MFIYKDSKGIKKEVKKLCIAEDVTLSEIARRLGIVPQQLNNKLNNKDIGFNNLSAMLQAMGYSLVIDFAKMDQPSTDHCSSKEENQ